MKTTKKGIWYDILGVLAIVMLVIGFIPTTRNMLFDAAKGLWHDSIQTIETVKHDTVQVTKVDTVHHEPIQLSKEESKPTLPTMVGDTIHLSYNKETNLFTVPVNVCGAKMNFILDTGCSDITISALEYSFMERHGYINNSSLKSKGTSTLADGKEIETIVCELNYIVLGTDTLKNVQCTIINSPDATPLLGQGIINKFGDIMLSYKNKTLIIFKPKTCY